MAAARHRYHVPSTNLPKGLLCVVSSSSPRSRLPGAGRVQRRRRSDRPSDPMNAVAELGRPVELGYDRTDGTRRLDGRHGPGPASHGHVSGVCGSGPGRVRRGEGELRAREACRCPAPSVQCYSVLEEEDLTFSALHDEESKQDFIEAKAELICGRALAPESDPSVASRFDGIVYVDAGQRHHRTGQLPGPRPAGR